MTDFLSILGLGATGPLGAAGPQNHFQFQLQQQALGQQTLQQQQQSAIMRTLDGIQPLPAVEPRGRDISDLAPATIRRTRRLLTPWSGASDGRWY